ncbi:MAG: glycosyl transferase family 2 [Dehalococcoidia bacterium]|nr:glycosyl transferase family 2 [Dehalococcoidia bacterium]
MATVDIIIPVYNEEADLGRSISILRKFLKENITRPWRITIADNGSTDNTLAVAQGLNLEYPDVFYIHLEQKGRGRALRKAWLESTADIVCYMDVDLSTGLEAFPQLIYAIESGYDVAIGSRLLPQSRVQRGFKRETLSRVYNLIIRAMFFTSFHDAQCGFKAVSKKAAQELIPLIDNQNWFFDTELLILAAKRGYKIKEIPVTWRDDPDTRVRIVRTVTEDLKGLARLRWRLWTGFYPRRTITKM